MFSNCTNVSNFHPLEVVGRGSETQLQMGENLNYFISAGLTFLPVYLSLNHVNLTNSLLNAKARAFPFSILVYF